MKIVHKVIVKKRKYERDFNNLKLVYVVYDVVEMTVDEDGATFYDVYQIYTVTDAWDFEAVDAVFKEEMVK